MSGMNPDTPQGPAAMVTAEAAREITDAQGRRIRLRRVGALEKLRLLKAVGPELAENEAYLGVALLAYACAAIDGIPLPAPVSEAQIEMTVERLGESGLAAIAAALAPAEGAAEVALAKK
jgi:hypothetical protein